MRRTKKLGKWKKKKLTSAFGDGGDIGDGTGRDMSAARIPRCHRLRPPPHWLHRTGNESPPGPTCRRCLDLSRYCWATISPSPKCHDAAAAVAADVAVAVDVAGDDGSSRRRTATRCCSRADADRRTFSSSQRPPYRNLLHNKHTKSVHRIARQLFSTRWRWWWKCALDLICQLFVNSFQLFLPVQVNVMGWRKKKSDRACALFADYFFFLFHIK